MKIPRGVVEYLCGFIPAPRPTAAALQRRSVVRRLWYSSASPSPSASPTSSATSSVTSSIEAWQVKPPHLRRVRSPLSRAVTPDTMVQSVCIRAWQWNPRPPFRIGRVEHRGGATQLLMRVEVDIDGDSRPIHVLVETGAQTNLIRR